MKKYLIDTNIAIFYIKGKFNLDKKFDELPIENYFISEVTLAELKYGVENSDRPEKNRLALNKFLLGVNILPILPCLDLYAKEKARLRRAGILIHDFDLLIGATAVSYNLIMVTNNTNHFERIDGIILQDWTKN